MNFIRTIPTATRFIIWIILALGVTNGIMIFAYGRASSLIAHAPILASIVLPFVVSAFLAWVLGLLRSRTRGEVALTAIVLVISFLIRQITFAAFLTGMTFYCATANALAGHYVCGL